MSLIKNRVHNELQKCFNDYFQLNLIMDDYVYYLQNKANLIKYADMIHNSMSHLAPIYADAIQEWADLREDRFQRDNLELSEDFENVVDWTQYVYDYCLEIENDLYNVIMVASEEKDISEDFVRGFFIENQVPFTHQISKFLDAIKRYSENDLLPSFNKDFSSYIIPEFQSK